MQIAVSVIHDLPNYSEDCHVASPMSECLKFKCVEVVIGFVENIRVSQCRV